jgi:hypothetical protein
MSCCHLYKVLSNTYDLVMFRIQFWAVVGAIAFTTMAHSQHFGKTPDVSCWDNGKFESLTVRTKIIRGKRGFVYGEVSTRTSTNSDGAELCGSTVRLLYSKDGKAYEEIYKDNQESDGLTVELIEWSSTGTRLVFATKRWAYDADADATVERSALLFNPANRNLGDLRLNESFQREFGNDCEFVASVVGWKSERSILVRVTKTPTSESYDQRFCVSRPRLYALDVQTRRIARLK